MNPSSQTVLLLANRWQQPQIQVEGQSKSINSPKCRQHTRPLNAPPNMGYYPNYPPPSIADLNVNGAPNGWDVDFRVLSHVPFWCSFWTLFLFLVTFSRAHHHLLYWRVACNLQKVGNLKVGWPGFRCLDLVEYSKKKDHRCNYQSVAGNIIQRYLSPIPGLVLKTLRNGQTLPILSDLTHPLFLGPLPTMPGKQV